MAMFTVRVELHGVSAEGGVYDELHGVMFDHGFLRTWTDANRKRWLLPHAEYLGKSQDPADELIDEVRDWIRAETSHRSAVGIIVTEWGNFDAEGLKPAPVCHRPGKIAVMPFCKARFTATNPIVKDTAAAKAQQRIKGGTLCRVCFPRPMTIG